ncbi:hypothetical protein [Pimelobacter sp. 30-1]|uniref:hypothetical protein n=1 Tax=Pimelobacter sp. 30-1 TaxID=2004991 RepID=UPI001C049A00|nr:hypothetical protein [Pimelobacter sp. 30-1]MBU2698571.1 hypothetical protein [Pimelobacter sp. 30-1]
MLAAILLAAQLLTVAPSAQANNWYGNTGYTATCPLNGNMTDNKDIYFWNIDIVPDHAAAQSWTRSTLLNPTTLDTFPAESLNDSTDVVSRDRYYTDWCTSVYGDWTTDGVYGLIGITACYRTVANGRCDQQVVRISTTWFDYRGTPGDRFVVCHELGHAIGLIHRNTGSGCIWTGTGISTLNNYTAHDLGHINAPW